MGGLFLLWAPLPAQYYDAKKRSLQTYRDLPVVSIQKLSPSTLSDISYLQAYAADTVEIDVLIHPWMSSRDTTLYRKIILFPGKNVYPFFMYGLEEGDYTMRLYCRNEKIESLFFKIWR